MTVPFGPGSVIAGKYRLERVLGQGGMGVVMAARHVHLGTPVAIKLMLRDTLADSAALRRFLREGRAAASLRGEHVARVHDAGVLESGAPYLALEYLEGSDLGALVKAQGALPIEVAVDYVRQACAALAEAHALGIIHRDIKPGNLFLTRRADGSAIVKVIDFGIAKRPPAAGEAGDEVATRTFAVMGTPEYMAPEQMRAAREVDARADLWSLGAVLFRLLSGEPPFPGKDVLDVHAAIQRGAPPLRERRPEVSPGLEAVVLRCLREAPAERYPDVETLAAALAEHAPPERRGAAPGPRPPDPSSVATSASLEPGGSSTGATLSAAAAPATVSRLGIPEIRVQPPLIGRDEAQLEIARAAEQAAGGSARVVVISGPLGIGRTRLLSAGVELAGLPPERVLRASCSPERRSPLRPLRRALDALPPAGRAALEPLSSALDRALTPAALPSAGDADSALEGVEAALLEAAAAAPLLLSIDDIQWADAATLRLLQLLVEQAIAGDPARLLVLAAARNEPSPTPRLRALLGAVRSKLQPAARHLALAPLAGDDAARLAQAIAPLAPELEQAVARGSGGVPFFAVHALLAWREIGAIRWHAGAFHGDSAGSLHAQVPGVAELVEDRLASFFEPGSEAERAGLRALAAIALHGEGLSFATLCAVAGSDDLVERALQTCLDAGILTVSVEPQEYAFAQEMVRQSVLGLGRKRSWFPRLHRALLDVIAAGSEAASDAAFLADGYARLGAAEPARLWLRRAMDAAIAAGQFDEASELGDRLAGLLDDAEGRAGVELDIVRALVRGRAFEEASRRLEGATSAAWQPGGAADLRRRIYRLQVARGRQQAGAADPSLLADADALGDDLLRCEARMAVAGVTLGARAMTLAGEAVELAARCGPVVELLARVLRVELTYQADRRDIALAEADLKRALALAAATSSVWQQLHIEGDLAVIEVELGRLSAAIDRLFRLAAQAERYGMRGQRRLLLQSLAAFLLRAGRAGEAAEVAEQVATLATAAGDPALRAVALSLRADALRRCGDLDAARRCIDEAVTLQEQRADAMLSLTLLRRAEILVDLGRIDEAMGDARQARRVAEQHREQDRVIRATVWEALQLARRGGAERGDLARVIEQAEAAEVTLREPTRALLGEARAWLSEVAPAASS